MKKKLIQLLGIVLLMLLIFPLINIFDKPYVISGIPILYIYIFSIWIIAIILMAYIISNRKKKA